MLWQVKCCTLTKWRVAKTPARQIEAASQMQQKQGVGMSSHDVNILKHGFTNARQCDMLEFAYNENRAKNGIYEEYAPSA